MPTYREMDVRDRPRGYNMELGSPVLLTRFRDIHYRMWQMVREAQQYILVSAFELDADHVPIMGPTESFATVLEAALARGVHVCIQTTALNINSAISHTGLHTLSQRYPQLLVLQLDRRRQSDSAAWNTVPWARPAIQMLSMLPGIDRAFWETLGKRSTNGLHRRFVCTDRAFLLAGGNCSRKYSEAEATGVRWFDAALYFPGMHTALLQTIRTTVWPLPEDVPRARPIGGFLFDNWSIYREMLRMIQETRTSLVIQNQYFFTGAYGQNEIATALIRRIERAYLSREPFHVTLYTNLDFRDDGSGLRYDLYRSISRTCLCFLMDRVQQVTCGNMLQYLSIYTPPEGTPWCIHTKIMGADHSDVLFSTANVFDAGLHPDGFEEIGWISRQNPTVYHTIVEQSCRLLRQFTRRLPGDFGDPVRGLLDLIRPESNTPLGFLGESITKLALCTMPMHYT